jgi:hypothetical protein
VTKATESNHLTQNTQKDEIMEIVSVLTEKLGITEDQAKAGSGAILKMAKQKLGKDDFNKIAEVIPGMDELLAAAPEGGGLGRMIGSLASSLGVGGGKLGSLAGLADNFKKLGLDADMVGKFVPIILSFVQSKGGDAIKNLLAGVMK